MFYVTFLNGFNNSFNKSKSLPGEVKTGNLIRKLIHMKYVLEFRQTTKDYIWTVATDIFSVPKPFFIMIE